jgi:anti-sigma28 factor (negative regulator of flagellin synthesis)
MTSTIKPDSSIPDIAKLLEQIALMQSQTDGLTKQKQDSETTQPTPLKDLDKQAATDVDTQNDEEEDDEDKVDATTEDILTGKWFVDMPFLASGQYDWQTPYKNDVISPAASNKELPNNFIIPQKEISRLMLESIVHSLMSQ